MKSSLKKLRGLGRHKNDSKVLRECNRPLAQLDEFSQAVKDMEDMKSCYDTLYSAAAATTNSVYEFSEALREQGACLLEKNALNDDEDSGKVLLLLGKTQFELQELLDRYRKQISKTITIPSMSLLNELRTVEEMKQLCDTKREAYEEKIKEHHKEKGRSGSAKGEFYSSLQAARDEYEEDVNIFVFRLKSLKQGQSRSLLTQAARHHTAQIQFFRKALKSAEAVEPHLKYVAGQQHIDYDFNELEDDSGDGVSDSDDDDDDSYGSSDDGALSFDYDGPTEERPDVATSKNLMELDLTFHHALTPEASKELGKRRTGYYGLSEEQRAATRSAPLFADKKFETSEQIKQMRLSSTRKLHTYVLPTPDDAFQRQTTLSAKARYSWHSPPSQQLNNTEKIHADDRRFSGPTISNAGPSLQPCPLGEGLLFPQFGQRESSDTKKVKRQYFSGPLPVNKAWSTRPLSGPVPPDLNQKFSGPILRDPMSQRPSSLSPPKTSPMARIVSSPKISELHELPLPPVPAKSTVGPPARDRFIGYSAPLMVRAPDFSGRIDKVAPAPLPSPPQSVTRSFSIPTKSPLMSNVNIASPPLTPISFPSKPSHQVLSPKSVSILEPDGSS